MSAARRVVLVVLENAEQRAVFNQALAHTPHALIFSFDGADGFDRFLEARPDVVFVAEMTTRISGNILCRLIREHRFGRGVGVFMMRPRAAGADVAERAADFGVDGFLPLPPEARQIVESIEGPFAFRWDITGETDLDEEVEATPAFDLVGEPLAAEAGEQLATGQTAEHVTLYVRPPEEQEHGWPAPGDGEDDDDEAAARAPAAVEFGPSRAGGARPGPGGIAEAWSKRITFGHDTEKIPTLQRAPSATTPVTEETAAEPPDTEERPQWRASAEERTPVEHPTAEVAAPAASPAFGPPTLEGSIEEVPGAPPPTEDLQAEPAAGEDAQQHPGAAGAYPPAQREVATPISERDSQEEPTPVVERPSEEEPTPVSEPGAAVFGASGEVRGRAEDTGEVFASSPVDSGAFGDHAAASIRTGGYDGESYDSSGIYPLAPEERDSDTLRRAISDSQLGNRLTRRILALYRLLDAVDYYQLLGVPNDAEPKAVQDAFHSLVLEYHPDRFYSLAQGLIKDRVGALYRRISEAYSVLSHPERRARYDSILTEHSAGPPPRFLLGEAQEPRPEDGAEASTPVGRKYLRLAFAAMAREDLDAAHLNLTFALGHEPDNELLRQRLREVERQLQRAQSTP